MAARKKKKSVKHRNLLRRKKDSNSTYWRKKADIVWARMVRRIGGGCAVCERTDRQLHAHHLITRRRGNLRHKLQNGVCLCAYHHLMSEDLSAHKAPLEFFSFMEEKRPLQWKWVQENRRVIDKYDYEAAYRGLVFAESAISAGVTPRGYELDWHKFYGKGAGILAGQNSMKSSGG